MNVPDFPVMGRVAMFFAVALLFATAASAHHSHTRFDLDRVVAFQGTVNRFEWKNPHVYLTVEDESGAEWTIETDPTPVMSRSGWTRESFTPGDAVVVRANPDRRSDVTHALLLSIEGPDGVAMASWNTTTQDTHDGPVAIATSLEGVWQGERSSLKNFVIHMSAQPLTAKGEAEKAAYNQLLNPTLECISWPTPFILSSYLYLSSMELGDDIITFRNEFYGTDGDRNSVRCREARCRTLPSERRRHASSDRHCSRGSRVSRGTCYSNLRVALLTALRDADAGVRPGNRHAFYEIARLEATARRVGS
jgi:hypothetical protein